MIERLAGLHLRVSGQSINAYLSPQNIKDGKDRRQLQGYWPEPHDAQIGYTVANLRTEYAMRNTHVPVGPWRGVNTNQNGLYLECFMEEVAAAAGRDPLEFRRALMQQHPKHLAVLNAAADKAGWGKPLANTPEKRALGLALHESFGSIVAQVAEVSVQNKQIVVHRVVCAIDCGTAVNPMLIAQQMESSVVFGLSAALFGEITIDKGRVQQSNFNNYPVLRMPQAPVVDTHIIESDSHPEGVGEPGTPPVAPAVANAVFALTGQRLRQLPLRLPT